MNDEVRAHQLPLHHHAARDYLSGSLASPQKVAPMPQVCAQLAELTARPETDARQLVRLIQTDPVVVGEIMRVANSAALRPRAPIASLQQAVSWLGVAEVRNITVAATLRGEVFCAPGHEPQSEQFWREAWLASLWAKEIARKRRRHVESAFLAALMHRSGAALALKILSRFELENRTAIDAQSFRGLIAEFEPTCCRLLTNNWRLPPEVQLAACEWSSYAGGASADLSGTVLAAHLLAEHTLHPQLIGEDEVRGSSVFEQLGIFPDERDAIMALREQILQLAGA